MTRSHNRIGALRSSANSHTSLNRQLLNLTHFSYFRFSLCPSKRQLYFWFLSGAAKTEIACKCPLTTWNCCSVIFASLAWQMEVFTLDYKATPSFAPILFLINLSQQLIWKLWETSNVLHVNRPLQLWKVLCLSLTFKYFPRPLLAFFLFWCNPFVENLASWQFWLFACRRLMKFAQ